MSYFDDGAVFLALFIKSVCDFQCKAVVILLDNLRI